MQNVTEYIATIDNQTRRKDAELLLPIMEQASGYHPYLCGTMIGFGEYHYRYESGHEGDWFVTGFAPRKQNMVVYVMPGFEKYQQELSRIGKYKTGKSCLYFGALKNVDLNLLATIVKDSVKVMQSRYDCKPSPS